MSALAADLVLYHRLRNAGLPVGPGRLEGLVAIRRARRYGEGDAALLAALAAIAGAASPQFAAAPDGATCPDCRGLAWRYGRDGSRVCGNCGFIPQRRSL